MFCIYITLTFTFTRKLTSFTKYRRKVKYIVLDNTCVHTALCGPPPFGILFRNCSASTVPNFHLKHCLLKVTSPSNSKGKNSALSYPSPLERIFQTPPLLMLSLSKCLCMIFLTIWMPEMDISGLRPKACLDLDRVEHDFIVPISWKSPQKVTNMNTGPIWSNYCKELYSKTYVQNSLNN